MKCPACEGKRWVDSKYRGPSKCPVCNGSGSIDGDQDDEQVDRPTKKKPYNQDKAWVNFVRSMMSFDESLDASMDKISDEGAVDSIVHMITKSSTVPTGGIILRHMLMSTVGYTKQDMLSKEHLLSRGYILDDDGKIITVNDVPIGKFYTTLEKWKKSNADLFMNEDAVKIDPNRKGNPFFMDDNKAAIGVTCPDKDSLRRAIIELNKDSGNNIVRIDIYQIL